MVQFVCYLKIIFRTNFQANNSNATIGININNYGATLNILPLKDNPEMG